MTQIFDTHCHYNLEPLFSGKIDPQLWPNASATAAQLNWQGYWQQAQQAGVIGSLIASSSLSTSRLAIEIAQQTKNLFVCVGIHPLKYLKLVKQTLKNQQKYEVIETAIAQHLEELERLIKTHRLIITALGEIGLDYYSLPKKGLKKTWMIQAQQTAFLGQLALAQKYQLPIVIHVRDKNLSSRADANTVGGAAKNAAESSSAYSGATTADAHADIINLLQKYYQPSPDSPLILHCISGDVAYAQQGLALGAFLGVAGNVTYDSATNIREIVKSCPPDRLLVETDAPYLAPGQNKGQICHPAWIAQTVEFLQQKLAVDPEKLLANARRALKLVP